MGLMEPGATEQRLQTDSEDWCNAYFVTSSAGRGGGDAMYMFSAPNEAKVGRCMLDPGLDLLGFEL